MTKFLKSTTFSTGLAIFSMLFGAGNLMYPLQVGMMSGDKIVCGILSFILTAVILPVMGFCGMILFNGDYLSFFYRLGKTAGSCMIFLCMLIIGPLLVIPRIVTLSHTMLAPFLSATPFGFINYTSSCIFALIFLSITFLVTYRENRIMNILGNIISPLLLLSLAIIITKGLWFHGDVMRNTESIFNVCKTNFMLGYETLDLLGALFLASIVLSMIKANMDKSVADNPRLLALVTLKASLIGVGLLSLVYIGMALLGMYYGYGLEHINAGELFRTISFRVLGTSGAIIIATAVLMACLSTAIALSAVVAEYLQKELLHNRIGFVTSLFVVLVASLPLSIAGLTTVLKLTGGFITYIGYPVLIMLTLVNILFKLFNFKPVKLPVAVTFVLFTLAYLS